MSNDQKLDNHFKPGSVESWAEAKEVASLIGLTPSIYLSPINFLRIDNNENNNNISDNSLFAMEPLLRSLSFRIVLYAFAKTFKEEESVKSKATLDLLRLFKASEVISFLATLYLQRRIKKGMPKEIWHQFNNKLRPRFEISCYLGKVMPSIGLDQAILQAGVEYLGMAMFAGIEREKFKKLKFKNYDLNNVLPQEEKNWKCNHVQVGALLYEVLNIPFSTLGGIVKGLLSDIKYLIDDHQAYRAKVQFIWTNVILQTGQEPKMVHKGEFYPTKKMLDQLLEYAELAKNNQTLHWLDVSKSTIDFKLIPQYILTDFTEEVDI